MLRNLSQIQLQLKESLTQLLCALMRGERVDWQEFDSSESLSNLSWCSRYHGVGALVYYLARSTPAWDHVPQAFRADLSVAARSAAGMELARAQDLLVMNRKLRGEGIDVILLKGAGLAYTLYPQPYLRSRTDTDLLIDIQHVNRFRRLVEMWGYSTEGMTFKSRQFKCYSDGPHATTITYDVHWRASNCIEYARVIDYAAASRESLPVPELEDIQSLSLVPSLLLACMHRAGNPYHDPDRLIWIYDIHLLLSAMIPAQMKEFSERAVAENIQDICLSAINKAVAYFATPVPREIADCLSRPVRSRTGLSVSPLGLISHDLIELPDIRSRAAFVKEYLFPGGNYLLTRYGKSARWWVPALYLRYLTQGVTQRISLR